MTMPCGDSQYARSASGRSVPIRRLLPPSSDGALRAADPAAGTRKALEVSLGLLGLLFTDCGPQVLPMLTMIAPLRGKVRGGA